ncbi:restriction endonuclease subunit S [Dietzia sp. Alg238-R159]|uniref:restriction endonuclease subunit S n=1 Tax=Dietzia sp. Alg238-R159 TaxID=2305986 RepID=UPI0013D03F7F|nr:restriction endonuclease subunit S [Dietzia sp. Alg238-R159]
MSYTDNSAFAGSGYELWPLGTLVEERSETGDAADLAPLSVGKQGVTAQLAGVAKSANTSSRKVVRAGDIAINSRSDRRGAAGLARQDGTISVVYSVMTPNPHLLDKEYAHHLFRSVPFQEEFFRFGTGIHWDLWSTRFTSMRQIPVPLPPLPTQRAIADYLDRETAEIDAMAAELDGLEDTLSSRRDAEWESLYRGVSGPEIAVQYLIESIADGPFGSALTSSHYSDSGYRVIRLGNLGINEYRDADKAYIPEMYGKQLDRHSVTTGDVVMAGLGDDKMPLGRACVIPETALPAIVKADCYRLRPRTELISSGYLAWALSSPSLREIASLQSRGSTRSRLNTEIAKSLRLRVPDLAVQSKILDEWRSASSAIDSMIADAKELKALLAERRSALITEVVTGRKAVFSSEL